MSLSVSIPKNSNDPALAAIHIEHRDHSWVVSLLFWASLLVSGGIYSTVSLSPKIAEWLRVRDQYAENAVRLVELEDEVEYLERFSATLHSDPEFGRRLSQATGNEASEPGHFVPVNTELLFGRKPTPRRPAAKLSESPAAAIVFRIASDIELRRQLLVISGCLIMIGFTFLNGSGIGTIGTLFSIIPWLLRVPVTRYARKHKQPSDSESTGTVSPASVEEQNPFMNQPAAAQAEPVPARSSKAGVSADLLQKTTETDNPSATAGDSHGR